MNFKDKYRQENEEIVLDAAFTNQLAGQMKKEREAQRRRKKMLVSMGGVAAAAVMCVVVLHGVNNTTTQPEQQDVQKKAETVETSAGGHGFGHQMWYGDAETEEEIFEAFMNVLQNKKIETLYCSDAEEYEEENILSEKETEKIVEALQKAEVSKEELEGKCKYFMAVFENGSIVKFEIYGEKYLKLKDSELVYSF